jgi:hypothetical protein
MASLGEEYPKEQARCREVLATYEQLRNMPGVNVSFAVTMIEGVLQRADRAAIEGDVVAMIRCYEEMKGCE